MRNLKRALSLAMASVMLLGMMVVGTGAGYKDVSSEDNQEAIEVLQKVGIMVGDEKGNFNPDQNVTRNEMAVIMSNLMDYRVATYSGTSPFTDVPSWAEPYVAACYTNGITSGISATQYGGDQTVTTAQAALMLMKALGYFQYQSDFGDDWQLATVSQGTKIDLFLDVESGVREAMTRNDVAQLVLNTLKSGMVEADDDTIKVDAGDVTVEAGKVTYNYITSGEKYSGAIKSLNVSGSLVNSGERIVELGEKLYQGDLKLDDDSSNNFGAPSNKWTYKAAEIGTYAKEADQMFEGIVKSNAMYDAVGKNVAKEYRWVINLNGEEAYTQSGDDKDMFDKADVTANNTKDLKGTNRGATTYVYIDDDAVEVDGTDYSGTITVCIVDSFVAEINKVDDGTITIDDDSLEFDVEGYDEEDIILYTKSYDAGTKDWTVESVIGLAERVEGEASKIKANDSVTIDGTTYKYSKTFADDKLTTDSVDQNVAFYLDAQGNIIMMDEAIESNDYAYVMDIGVDKATFSKGDDVFYAKMLLTDGTILSKVEIDGDTAEKYGLKNAAGKDTGVYDELINQIVAYSKEDDGTYTMNVKTNVTDTGDADMTKSGTSRVKLAGKTLNADKNTVFIVADDISDDEYDLYVGYNNVPEISAAGLDVIAYTKSGIAKVVVVVDEGASVKGAAKDVFFVVGLSDANEKKPIKDSSGTYYVYDAIVDGEVTTLNVKADSAAQTELFKLGEKEIGVYFGKTENSKGFVTDVDATEPADVSVIDTYKGTKKLTSAGILGFDYNKGTDEYDYRPSGDDVVVVGYYDGDDLSVTDVNGIKTDKNDKTVLVIDDGSLVAVMIVEVDG